MRFLMVESEMADDRRRRRESVGHSAGESFAATLRQMVPGCSVDFVEPAEEETAPMRPERIAAFDAVFLSGSPLHVYEDRPEVRRQLAFMRAVFASGTPSFGSCAGLQVAVAAAGGRVRAIPRDHMEAGIARRIVATAAGRAHPLLAGRPPAWDAPAAHGDEVEALPEGALLLAGNAMSVIQAAEIRHGRGVFWGVQYHPELASGEIGEALRRQADGLIDADLARDRDDVEAQARLFDQLHDDPHSRPVRWRLGIDDEVATEAGRRREIANFIEAIPALANPLVVERA